MQLIGFKEMLKRLDVSDPTLRRMVKGNEIPYQRIRGSIKFNMQKVEGWLQQTSLQSTPELVQSAPELVQSTPEEGKICLMDEC